MFAGNLFVSEIYFHKLYHLSKIVQIHIISLKKSIFSKLRFHDLIDYFRRFISKLAMINGPTPFGSLSRTASLM